MVRCLHRLQWLTVTHLRRGGEVAALAFMAAALPALGAGPAFGQTVNTKLGMVTDAGGVNDIVRAGNTIYISGGFTQVGPYTGRGVPASAATGRPTDIYPRVSGEVAVAAADGHGGWFIGGSFFLSMAARGTISHMSLWTGASLGGIRSLMRRSKRCVSLEIRCTSEGPSRPVTEPRDTTGRLSMFGRGG